MGAPRPARHRAAAHAHGVIRPYDGGHHLFFKRPERQLVATRLPEGIDLKDGGKGYTILPPSVHPDTGGVYLWRHENVPAAPLPDAVDKLLIPLNQKRVQGEYTPTGDAASEFRNSGNKRSAKALAALLRLVGNAEEGERNKKLYWAGRRIADDVVSDIFHGFVQIVARPGVKVGKRNL